MCTYCYCTVYANKICARKQPTVQFEGERSRGPSSTLNSEFEVGNCGFYFGHWGRRAIIGSGEEKKLTTETQYRQIMKNPGQVLILCETTEAVAALLSNPAVAAEKPGVKGLEGRSTFEHWVVRGNEEDSAVLIAARKDNCSYLQLLDYDVNPDHGYRAQGKDKMATTRTLICRVGFKQNVGHIGRDVVACGVHGHSMTMKCEWSTVWEQFWDALNGGAFPSYSTARLSYGVACCLVESDAEVKSYMGWRRHT